MGSKRIEDAFTAHFSGDTLQNALDFAAFLRANDMMYDGAYEIHYKGELACYIDTPSDTSQMWSIWTVGDYRDEYEGFPIDAHTKEIAWANVVHCGNCEDCDRDPGKTEVIFGKECTHVCNGTAHLAMRFINPDAEALACAKNMIAMKKYAVDNPIA